MESALTSVELAAFIRDIAITTFLVIGALGLLVGIALGFAMYRRTKSIVDRVDRVVKRGEDLVDTIDSAASSVKRTASSVNQGMRAGAYVRSAMGSFFDRRKDDTPSGDKKKESDE